MQESGSKKKRKSDDGRGEISVKGGKTPLGSHPFSDTRYDEKYGLGRDDIPVDEDAYPVNNPLPY